MNFLCAFALPYINHIELEDNLTKYFNFVSCHIDNLKEIELHKSSGGEYQRMMTRYLSFDDEIWYWLGLVNINIIINNYEYVRISANHGVRSLQGRNSGQAWLRYFDNRANYEL